MRTCKIPIIATLLLLAFAHKLGVLVLVHNKFHASVQTGDSGNTAGYYQVKCDCLEEALAPLSKPECHTMPLPEKGNVAHTVTADISFFSAVKIYRSLRAPPTVA